MKVIDTALPEVKILEPMIFGDERGYFMETYRDNWFREAVASVTFVQDNQSSSKKGALRGLHYQLTQPQGKLVRVVSGEVFDVAVDIRRGSPRFGQWVGVYLSAENKRQMWVPPGFAHGFLVTSEAAEFSYKCTDYYHAQSECTILWGDPTIGIDWPIGDAIKPILSAKDEAGFELGVAPTFNYGQV